VAVSPLRGLAEVAVRRILLGDKVAAAKYGTPRPIDDPARERQVLAASATSAQSLGVDPAESSAFFRDQIEASKVVQRGLYQYWTAHPERRPSGRPDLGNEVRPQLDQITKELLQQLLRTNQPRHDYSSCRGQLLAASATAGQTLDSLHQEALAVALRSVCAPR
jgi:chorismate mutase